MNRNETCHVMRTSAGSNEIPFHMRLSSFTIPFDENTSLSILEGTFTKWVATVGKPVVEQFQAWFGPYLKL